jgi:hypothetical protein
MSCLWVEDPSSAISTPAIFPGPRRAEVLNVEPCSWIHLQLLLRVLGQWAGLMIRVVGTQEDMYMKYVVTRVKPGSGARYTYITLTLS